MTGSNDNPRTGKRLDTWKEIGGFFGRDERTVKRWEMTRKLPVHRVPGGGRANVYAYEDELAEWLRSSDAQVDERGESTVESDRKSGTDEPRLAEAGSVQEENGGDASVDGSEHRSDRHSENRSWGKSALILAALIVVVGGGLLIYRSRESVVSGGMPPGKPGGHQVAPESEELYLKGIYYWHNRTPESLNQAVDYFTQAI